MPYVIRKRGNWWLTVNAETGKVKGRHEIKKKAESQARLIMAREHGWEPTGKGGK